MDWYNWARKVVRNGSGRSKQRLRNEEAKTYKNDMKTDEVNTVLHKVAKMVMKGNITNHNGE